MPFDELINYVKKEMERGVSPDEIKASMRFKKWKEQDIQDALKAVSVMREMHAEAEYPTNQLMKGGELMKRSLKIYRERIGTFLGITALPIFVMILIFGAGFLIFGEQLFPDEVAYGENYIPLQVVIFFVVAFLFIIPVFILQQIALILAIKNRGERGILKFYKQAKDYFLKYIGTVLLVWLIVFGGFLLLIIPGVIFMIFYSLATLLVIMEGLGGMDALRKSKEYIKKDIRGYVSRWTYLIFIFIGALIGFSIIIAILFFKYPDAGQGIIDLVSFLLIPIPVIYSVELYRNLEVLNREQ